MPDQRRHRGRPITHKDAAEWVRKRQAGATYRQVHDDGGPAFRAMKRLEADPNVLAIVAGAPPAEEATPLAVTSPMTTVGAPTAIRDDLIRAAVERGLAMGAKLATVAELAGIHVSTLQRWLRKAREDPDTQTFGTELLQARALGEVTLLERVSEGGPGWQGAAWVLARGCGYHEKVEASVVVSSAAEAMSDDELRGIIVVQASGS